MELIYARDLRVRGESTRTLEAGVRSARFVRLRPGVYVLAESWMPAEAEERHRALVEACAATAVREPVFCHETAALLQGIPVIGSWPELPQTLDAEPRPNTRRSRRGVIVHRPRHTVVPHRVGGLLMTGLIDTAIALAATRSLASGVAAFDRALASGVSREELAEIITLRRPFHGAVRALRALDIATGLAETPLESISLVPIALAGLPRPEQQVEKVIRGRRCRLDFLWPDLGIVGEADGRGKYRDPEDLWNEKRRQDALESTGLSVARWGWNDALAGQPLLDRLREAGMPFAPQFAIRTSRIS